MFGILLEICHIGAGHWPSKNFDPSQCGNLSTLIVLNEQCERLDALIQYIFKLDGTLFHLFARQMQRLCWVHVLGVFKSQIVAINKQMHLAGIRFWVYAVVEFNKFN